MPDNVTALIAAFLTTCASLQKVLEDRTFHDELAEATSLGNTLTQTLRAPNNTTP